MHIEKKIPDKIAASAEPPRNDKMIGLSFFVFFVPFVVKNLCLSVFICG